MNMNPICAELMEAAKAMNTAPDDYINPADGLKYCGKCIPRRRRSFLLGCVSTAAITTLRTANVPRKHWQRNKLPRI